MSTDVKACHIIGSTNRLLMVQRADTNYVEHIALLHVIKISKEIFENKFIVRLHTLSETITLQLREEQLNIYEHLIETFGRL